jgi:enoyl-CoA hydratase/carnithine racemase
VDFEEILYDVEDRVATITLHRPEKLNAQTGQMTAELHQAFAGAESDDDVRAVIVTGAGRAFCAGSDMSAGPREPLPGDAPQPEDSATPMASGDGTASITMRLYDFPKPVIAAINGAAVGFGVSSTLAMDIRIASTAGRFGFVYSQRGIAPESASSWFLPRIVGIEQALSWMYSGKVFGADEALAGGLVSEVVDPEDLLERAQEIAAEIATLTSPVSVAFIRQSLWKGLGTGDPSEMQQLESQMTRATRGSEDGREGILSFLEQRPPAFTSKVSTDMPEFYPWWETQN